MTEETNLYICLPAKRKSIYMKAAFRLRLLPGTSGTFALKTLISEKHTTMEFFSNNVYIVVMHNDIFLKTTVGGGNFFINANTISTVCT